MVSGPLIRRYFLLGGGIGVPMIEERKKTRRKRNRNGSQDEVGPFFGGVNM